MTIGRFQSNSLGKTAFQQKVLEQLDIQMGEKKEPQPLFPTLTKKWITHLKVIAESVNS